MENKRTKLLTIMALILLAIAVIGATYAYFQAQGGSTVTRNVTVTTHTVDTLTFSVSNDIAIEATQQNFSSTDDNLDGYATVTAILTPNSKTGAASKNYYIYLNIPTNETVYSEENTNSAPELLLQVFDSSNQLVTLTGLGTQKTVDTLTGYDITGKVGLYTILDNHQISASNNEATTETYRVVVTLINHDFDQYENTGKQVVGSVVVSEESTTYCDLNPTETVCNFSLTFNPATSNTITLTDGYLYHHDSTLTNGAGDGSYRFAGANPNNYVCFGSDAATCPADNLYRIIGLIPVDVVIDETDPNNPVTQKQMLYKLIKNDYMTSTELGISISGNVAKATPFYGPSGNQPAGNVQGFYWSGSANNENSTWSLSTLNTIGLNTNYLINVGNNWVNKIEKVIWKVGGGDDSYIRRATQMSTVYRNEITESGEHVTNSPTDGKNEYAAKVGLMYVSDYGYASPSTVWTTALNGYGPVANNWLYKGVQEWVVTRCSESSRSVYNIEYNGVVSYHRVTVDFNASIGVRATFYLNSNTTIDMTTHAGTASDPYRIS